MRDDRQRVIPYAAYRYALTLHGHADNELGIVMRECDDVIRFFRERIVFLAEHGQDHVVHAFRRRKSLFRRGGSFYDGIYALVVHDFYGRVAERIRRYVFHDEYLMRLLVLACDVPACLFAISERAAVRLLRAVRQK